MIVEADIIRARQQGYQFAIEDLQARQDCKTAREILTRNLTTTLLKCEQAALLPAEPPKYRDVLRACGWVVFAVSFGFACMVCVGLS